MPLGSRTIRSPGAGEREAKVLAWLLEHDQPAVRYRALVDLLDRRESDPAVREARAQIGRVGWAADQLRAQGPKGYWEKREPRNVLEWFKFLWQPMYRATIWRALVLSDLGLDSKDARVRRTAEVLMDYKLRFSSPINFYYEEMCMVGNTARMLTRFGYGEDRRVLKLYDWMLEDQRRDGGWNCSQDSPGTLDAWEPMAAFAAVPKRRRSSEMERAIERGAEFYLKRRLFQEGSRYAPWFRLHYPRHYFYDILVGLEFLTELGFSDDRRLRPALEILRKKRRADGTWWMEPLHPDVGAGPKNSAEAPKERPLVIERPGRPSKWITLKALTVLKRTGEA